MGKRPVNPPKDPLKRLPRWQEQLLNQHFKGLSGLFVRQLVDKSIAAERSERAKHSADTRHERGKRVKQQAHAHYVKNRRNYNSNKAAAADLVTRFGEFEFRTYENWVSQWSSE
jgi:hypothetical protein